MNFSVVIITKNEAHNIGRCIESCLALSPEIIVLDSHSTDGTVQIAQKLGARVVDVDWKGYGPTKNYGAQLATNDWILSLDADEALDNELQQSVLKFIKNPKKVSACWLSRSLVFFDKLLKYGAVHGEKRVRLYNRNELKWNDKSVHEDMEPFNGKIVTYGELDGNLLHYSYIDLADMKMRMDKYALLSAENLKQKSVMTLQIKRLLNPLVSFIKNYIFKMGFVDGKLGYVFAREQALYVFKKYNYALKN